MPAGEALPVRRADLLHAAAQHCFVPFGFLEHLVAGKAVADAHARHLFALGASEAWVHVARI